MTDKTAQPGKTGAAPAAAPPPLPRPPRWPALASLLALLLTLGIVGVGQLYWRDMQTSFAHLHRAVDRARQEQQAMVGQLEQATRNFTAQQQELQQQEQLLRRQVEAITLQREGLERDQRRLSEQEGAVRQTLENLHAEVGRTGQQWRAAEAAYLVEVARQRLRLERDAETALTALQSAAERLRETGDPRWLPVRERLSADMQALEAVPQPDRSALGKTLTRMLTGIDRLPLRTPGFKPATKPPPDDEAVQSQRQLDSLLRDGLSGLKSLVRINPPQRAPALPQGPEDSYAVRQNLRLQLDSARFALLRGDRDLYDSSLDTARSWINAFFKAEAPETRLYLDDIAELRAAAIHPRFPDLGPTLELLRAGLDEATQAGGDGS